MAWIGRTDVDWQAVEHDYRAGVKSLSLIAEEYGVSDTAIRKRARAGGWVRNEASQVRQRAQQLANERSIPKQVDTPADVVEATAMVAADILTSHRAKTAGVTRLAQRMVEQLHEQTEHEADLAEQIKEFFLAKIADNPLAVNQLKQQMNHALHAIGLGARSKTLLNLVGSLEKLQGMERRAWNLDEDGDKRSYEDLLAEIEANKAA